jgi:hypothetical protein
LRNYDVKVSDFEERSLIEESNKVVNEIYHRVEDQSLIFVKSIPVSKSIENSRMRNEIENLINLRHPCITGPIGFIFPIESHIGQEMKIVGLYLEGLSLTRVISDFVRCGGHRQ